MLAEYKADLWNFRATQQVVLFANPANAPPPIAPRAPMSLAVSASSGGSLLLKPRCASDEVAPPAVKPEPEVKAEATTGADDTELDDHAIAAPTAFESRTPKKKADQKKEREAEADAAKAAATQDCRAKKDMKGDKLKADGVKGEKLKAGGSHVKEEAVSKANISKACPTGESAPVLYKGGVI